MSNDTGLPMSRAAFEALQADLDQLIKVDRPDALRQLEDSLTDSVNVGESGTHHAAIAAKAQVDGRIADLRSRLSRAVVVEAGSSEEISVGSQFTLDFGDGDVGEFVLDNAAAAMVTAVSTESPLGEALLGARVGSSVTWAAPTGPMTATVTSIGS